MAALRESPTQKAASSSALTLTHPHNTAQLKTDSGETFKIINYTS